MTEVKQPIKFKTMELEKWMQLRLRCLEIVSKTNHYYRIDDLVVAADSLYVFVNEGKHPAIDEKLKLQKQNE